MELLEAKNAALLYIEIAAKETLKWFRTDLDVWQKEDKSPVTIADKNTEEILRNCVSKDFPDHGIIGEEFGAESESADWVWTLDPIDGTRSFIRGLPFYAILIALLHQNIPVMGIVSFPALGEIVWAVKGFGAWCGERKLSVSSAESQLPKAFVATADYYCFREKKLLTFYRDLQKRAALIRTYPDAFGHMMAVRGAVDVMVDPWAYIWDFAPFKILAEEAGGIFANFTGNRSEITEGTALIGNRKLVQALRKLYKDGTKGKKK